LQGSRETQFATPLWGKAAAILALAAVACLCNIAVARGAATYVFSPQLSLTGDCSETELDPVPDPGVCPIPPGTTFSGSPGADHPSAAFLHPTVAVDEHGDIYVASIANEQGRIDVFSPKGLFITEIADTAGPLRLAVDSEGNVYVYERVPGKERMIRRFTPTVYKPGEEKIEYGNKPVVISNQITETVFLSLPADSIAIGPEDHVYVDTAENITVLGSAKEGNVVLEKNILKTTLSQSKFIAIDKAHGKIYVTHLTPGPAFKSIVRIFELKSPYEEVGKFDGSTTLKGEFVSGEGNLPLGVDETTGHVFVGDLQALSKVIELEEDGSLVAEIERGFKNSPAGQIAIDNGPFTSNPGYLYVPSNPEGTGHVYAFEANEECEAKIESSSIGDITETEATLHATVNPCGAKTTYRLEYVSEEQFEEEEGKSFENENATIAGEGTLPKGGEVVALSAPALELQPGTKYRFHAFAENAKGSDEGESTFTTFGGVKPPPACPNDALRLPFSAALPDCRAYELVTPPNTNGRPPGGGFNGVYFPTLEASPDGNRLSFLVEGGTIPGFEAAGAFNGDPYRSTRGAEGWGTEATGPSGKEAVGPEPGSTSPDQTYSFWEDIETITPYVRYPDGHSAIVGRGSLADDPHVEAELITEGGGHIIFKSKSKSIPIEEDSPAAGLSAVYDRTADEVTHVVSLLPGDVTPTENATYLGASNDGEGIVFSIGSAIYVRLHNTETLKVSGSGAVFAGISEGGGRVFYLKGGDLFAFRAEKPAEPIEFSESGDATVVNVAADGTRAYFVSPSVLTNGGEPNPNGEIAEPGEEGEQNLYLSEEGQISFVGRVTERDIEGEESNGLKRDGMGLWLPSLKNEPAIDSSRTTPTGATLLFESRADLTGFESGGFAQVYRYDLEEGRLDCLSCNRTATAPTSDASLQSIAPEQFAPEPASSHLEIHNQSPDGKRAFFQSAEPLVIGDTDGKLDVYEWEEEGVGTCEEAGGCVYLISGPHSAGADYLYAMSESGDDVFFRTSDELLPRDVEATLSIYDARVEGGFPEPATGTPCVEGETCHPLPSPPPNLSPSGVSSTPPPPGSQPCPKGKHKVKRNGKLVCVKNHKHKKHHHHKAGHKGKGGAK
jgi:hypothetical protein